ncbi:MAG: hypothetical protein IKE21_06030 [Erysipelotrichaceae bacterium]|nr:hypothetical protein [Erysipelotrichaceae bacterium]
MIQEHKRSYGISCLIGLAAAFIFFFAELRTVSAGIILGLAFYGVYLLLLTFSVSRMLEDRSSEGSAYVLLYVLRILLLGLPLLCGALFPDIFNIFGAFGAILLNKIVTVILYGVIGKKGNL